MPFSIFQDETFQGFGPSDFQPIDWPRSVFSESGRTKADFKNMIQAQAPKRPGVYGMLDGRRRLIYIGKAKNLRNRLLNYCQAAAPKKARDIIRHARHLLWEEVTDEFGALLRELELIRRHRPKFNVVGQPDRPWRQVYLCIASIKAPFVYSTTDLTGKELLAFGPILQRSKVQSAVERLNDHFQLRNCSRQVPMIFSEQRLLFPEAEELAPLCFRHDIGTCSAPCAARCSSRKYRTQLRAARDFLEGKQGQLLQHLEARMKEAAASCEFERAAVLRDKLSDLQWLDDRLRFLRNVRSTGSHFYPIHHPSGGITWYVIQEGAVQGAIWSATTNLEQLPVDVALAPRSRFRVLQRSFDSVLIVHSWFKKFPAEKSKLIAP